MKSASQIVARDDFRLTTPQNGDAFKRSPPLRGKRPTVRGERNARQLFLQPQSLSDLFRIGQQCAYFGGHIEIVEVDELAMLRRQVQQKEIACKLEEFNTVFDVQPDCPSEELVRAARTSIALDQLVEIHRLGSLAYYYQGTGNAENEDTISSIILGTSLLTARGRSEEHTSALQSLRHLV